MAHVPHTQTMPTRRHATTSQHRDCERYSKVNAPTVERICWRFGSSVSKRTLTQGTPLLLRRHCSSLLRDSGGGSGDGGNGCFGCRLHKEQRTLAHVREVSNQR